ncbi:hypothetical protein [Pleionea sp. CnH1-48]|uniref:hypothetical protein n=1 Tax=Pleionea sp. CnH1-48 TaxID=2954494 RepID=UPI002097DC9B|nr:hypothetical protein [Pleionea sp. CnH1-48]MCO7225527.1 hypothetical protein [Pleionea sp. CnH1-48]
MRFALCLALLPSYLVAQEFDDPFAAPDFRLEEENKAVDFQANLFAYWQRQEVRSTLFNPGLIDFSERERKYALDVQLESEISSRIKGYFRAVTEHGQFSLNRRSESQDTLLEGYIETHSDDNSWWLTVGRKKLQWGNGFNWSPANLMQPYFDRPSSDVDNLKQLKGWDLIEVQRQFDGTSLSFWVAKAPESIEGDFQGAVRWSIEAPIDLSLILHKVEEGEINSALTWSHLLGEVTTLRAEWSYQKQRELPLSTLSDEVQNEGYHKAVVGMNYSFSNQWSFVAEYLHNEHGYDSQEWQSLVNETQLARDNYLNGVDVPMSLRSLFSANNILSNGQLRQRYAFLMLSNTQVDQFFQFRVSNQFNLDDDSYFWRVELFQNWTQRFSSRIEYEAFSGCEYCEFGLTPYEDQLRFAAYYVF